MEKTIGELLTARVVRMAQPEARVFGCGCVSQPAQDLASRGSRRAVLVTAQRGIDRIRDMCTRSGIPSCLSDFGVRDSDMPRLAASSLTVARLLKDNLRDVTLEDAETIHRGSLK